MGLYIDGEILHRNLRRWWILLRAHCVNDKLGGGKICLLISVLEQKIAIRVKKSFGDRRLRRLVSARDMMFIDDCGLIFIIAAISLCDNPFI